MALTITRKGDQKPVHVRDSCTLQVQGGDPQQLYTWRHNTKKLDEHGAELTFIVDSTSPGMYTVEQGGLSDAYDLKVEVDGPAPDPAAPAAPAPAAPEEPATPATFYWRFALVTALLLGAVVVVLAWAAIPAIWRFQWSQLADPEGEATPLVLATLIVLVLLVAGVVALFAGAWLTLVEARGRMITPPRQGVEPRKRGAAFPVDLTKLGEALGKLSGGHLLVFAGMTILFAVAWIGVNAIGGDTDADAGTDDASTSEPTESAAPADE